MPRQARVVIPGMPHHITQRGNNRQDVFFVDDDRTTYLELLRVQCIKHRVRLLGYCLMTNHVHLVALPLREDSLNLAVGRTHFIYTQYINRLHGRSGHLWQGRFHSCPMDDAYTVMAMRYIERNPVRAKITRVPWTYPWSSAMAHCGAQDETGLLDLRAWKDLVPGVDWKEMLTRHDEEEAVTALRRNTQTGRPLASDSLVSKLERALGRRLRPLPIGRPRKDTSKRKKKAQ
ncbi:MAG: transposase [Candidatus Hydrogenedentes bacterium]|nr:transposase [Candidatus Hydrogenedentota bacterium]